MTDATCRKCDTPIDGWATFVVYGEFDGDRQGFANGDHTWHVCRDCWHDIYDVKQATTYQTDDADELWAILEAADGQLVADLSTFFIPGPCYARVVDGDLETCTVNNNPHKTPEGKIGFDPEPEMIDEHDLFLENLFEGNDDPEYPVYLVTADETPFADLRDDVERRSRDESNADTATPDQ